MNSRKKYFKNNSNLMKLSDGDEIALVYFRSGYVPTDFPTENVKQFNFV
jgi:hypothetical protein